MYAQFSIKQATSNSLLNTAGSLELKGIPIHLTQQIQSITTMRTGITAKNKTNLSKTEKFPSGFCNANISSTLMTHTGVFVLGAGVQIKVTRLRARTLERDFHSDLRDKTLNKKRKKNLREKV